MKECSVLGATSRILAIDALETRRPISIEISPSFPSSFAGPRERFGRPSQREGLEETLTVVRLGVPGALRRTLATTNPIESALSVTRRVTARVTRWRDGDMRRRWCVAGLLRAESKFRRVKGHRGMTTLLKALEESTRARRSGIERGGA